MERSFNRNVRPHSKRLPVVDTSKMDLVDCLSCDGTGVFAETTDGPVECDDCDGTGKTEPHEDDAGDEGKSYREDVTASNRLGW